ncbi:hypothetical protein [Massilia yuzhufengensis]|uniref:hypothetical protein n=1 Tax=Massilia yuzhufengensis TaxID=1164594 RepID=UPI000B86627D|nr:hypothetical protein [Massilia yuzhufengensis]
MINVYDLPAVREQLARDAVEGIDVEHAASPAIASRPVASYPSKNLILENGLYRAVDPEE